MEGKKMKTTYIGQAGLIIETGGLTIMIDPYLSDSVVKVNPKNYRRVPVNEKIFDVKPDVMIFTHDHLDHYDPETVPKFINENTSVLVLAPTSAYLKARQLGGSNNYVEFNRHTEWTEGTVRFTAVKAFHSDAYAIGVIIESEGEKYYITGDTLYNEEIFADIPSDIDALFLPINGVGNNMNATDAARFAKRIGAKITVPFHIGMFDELSADIFEYENKTVPKLWCTVTE